MKRGSLVFLGPAPTLLPTFRSTCTYQPVFLRIYLRQLKEWGFVVHSGHLAGNWLRYGGDLVGVGKGEILVWQQSC